VPEHDTGHWRLSVNAQTVEPESVAAGIIKAM
jgi:hypothetical protein